MFQKIVFLNLFLLLLLAGCNEEPTNIGIDLLQDTILIDAISTDTTKLLNDYEVFNQKSPVFNAGAFLLGKTDEMESVTFFRFAQIPDSLEYLTPEDIISCKLIMYPNNYAIGDFKNPNLSFKFQKIIGNWNNGTKFSEVNNNPGAYLDETEYEGWSGEIDVFRDSIPYLEMDFPRDIITDWFEKEHFNSDTNNVADTIWGVAAIPQTESNTIHRFNGLGKSEDDDYTNIETVYVNQNGDTDTLNMTVAIEYSMINDNSPVEGSILIQGGLSLRTRLDFDVSALPDLSAIHKSELILHYDEEKSYWGSLGPDSVIALRLFDEIKPDDHTVAPILEWTADLISGTNQYKFESISSAVETWSRTPEKKGSVVLLSMPVEQEFRQADRMVFYGNDAENPDLRPKIKIIYSYIEKTDN